jgi:hypothetical protein
MEYVLESVVSLEVFILCHPIAKVIKVLMYLAILFWPGAGVSPSDQRLAFSSYKKPIHSVFGTPSELVAIAIGILISLCAPNRGGITFWEYFCYSSVAVSAIGFTLGRFIRNPVGRVERYLNEKTTLPILRRIEAVTSTSKCALGLLSERSETTRDLKLFRSLHREFWYKLPLGFSGTSDPLSKWERIALEESWVVGWACSATDPAYIRNVFEATYLCDVALEIAPHWMCVQECLSASESYEQRLICLVISYIVEFDYFTSIVASRLPIKADPRAFFTLSEELATESLTHLNELVHSGAL